MRVRSAGSRMLSAEFVPGLDIPIECVRQIQEHRIDHRDAPSLHFPRSEVESVDGDIGDHRSTMHIMMDTGKTRLR